MASPFQIVDGTPCSPCARRAAMRARGLQGRGLRGLGGDNILTDFTAMADNLWGNITGRTANQQAQTSALELQRITTERAIAEANARATTLKTVVPWVAGAAIVLVGAVVVLKVVK